MKVQVIISLFLATAAKFAGALVPPSSNGIRTPTALFAKSELSTQPSKQERHATVRKKWGVDKDEEYWFNPQIHTLGNTKFGGAFHAAIAPLSTKMIDILAYEGVDIREKVAHELAATLRVNQARIVDLCCGVGISTRALCKAFPDAEQVIGMDTSPEMVEMAKAIHSHVSFLQPLIDSIKVGIKKSISNPVTFALGNAERTELPAKSFDLVTIMYAFHEAPKKGRDRILREAHRLLNKGGHLALIDISPDYQASPTMLAGEPYVLEYQRRIDRQMSRFPGFVQGQSKTLIPGHVKMWLLKRV